MRSLIVAGAICVAASFAVDAVTAEKYTPVDGRTDRALSAPLPRRLNLGPYGRPDSSPISEMLEVPRYGSIIEVWGKAPRDPNRAMAVWWEHFDIEPTAVYGRGIAFRQPPPQGSVDVTPLAQWLINKIKKR